MPASTILLIDADARRPSRSPTALTGVGYTVTVSADPGRGVPARSPTTSSSIIDVVVGERTGVRRLPRDPVDARAGLDPDPVRRPDRRRRGADPLPRGRRGRRHGPAVRRPRARGPGRGPAPPVPALEGPRRRRLDRRRHRHPGAPDGRGPQPEGRRRDVDDRDEHRDGRRPAQARPGRDRRPRPPVRPGRDLPQRRAAPDARRRRPRRRRDARAGAAPDLRDAATTAGSTSSPRRSARSWPS